MTIDAGIDGFCAPRFAAVREAFAANFAAGREVGASFAATLDGETVIDLWGGHADAARTRAWERDTIVNVFSTTKAMTALCAHMLVERGQLDLDAPVARLWPQFAVHGKAAITLRQLLCHSAGVAALHPQMDGDIFYDWSRMTAALADETPWWEPGTANGYHALTFGYLVGELIRRADGRMPGVFFRDEVARPLGADFHIGLAASEDRRVGEMVPPTPEEAATALPFAPDSMNARVMSNPPLRPETANTIAWRRAEIPAANGHGNARSVARVMSALACGGTLDGVRLLSDETLANAIAEQRYEADLVLRFPIRWGLGFMLTSPTLPLGPNPRVFGHGGWGGSLGFADRDARASWSYVMNKMTPGTAGDNRAFPLILAFYAALSG
ncbi:MAG: serine hydrolase domain-containing protein [bacterium]